MLYEEFQVIATQVQEIKADGKKRIMFKVQVPRSPVGEVINGVDSTYDAREIHELIGPLATMQLEWSYAMQMGHILAGILFPQPIREILIRSRDVVTAQGKRLRIRLMLEGVLNNLPWEYVLLNQGGGEAAATDFLALSPDISIVRHEGAAIAFPEIKAELPAQLLVALSSPTGLPKLSLNQERQAIATAVHDHPHLTVSWKDEASPESLFANVPRAHLFHFAGHDLLKTELTAHAGVLIGEGIILLDDGYGDPQELSAGQLALQLRQIGVRVAVLGACESGRRDEVNVWSSIAAALLKAGLGAVVGMQSKIRDDSATTTLTT